MVVAAGEGTTIIIPSMLTLESLAELAEQHRALLKLKVREFDIRGRPFAWNARRYLMGVINLSPDSWYRESVCLGAEAAVRRGKVLQAEGADLVDLGAESTLAHAARADAQIQSDRLLPVVKELAEAGLLVSVETYDAAVARRCLEAGAAVLNLTGTLGMAEMFRMAAAHGAVVIICFVQGSHVREAEDFDFSRDALGQMKDYFARQIDVAVANGLERLLLDPGLGFYYRNLQDGATRVRHQAQVFLNTFRLRSLGFPVCHALPHAFEYFGEEVRSAEGFFALLASLGKADLLRTHEIPRVRAVLETVAACNSGPQPG